jgi:hypothetical protein
VSEYANQAVEYVRRALSLPLEYDSDTLPLLDHYLATVQGAEPAAMRLVITTAGAYFGEVVRRRLGGRWEMPDGPESDWRMVLPTGLNFSPLGFVAAAIAQSEVADFDSALDSPLRMRQYVEQTLQRMGEFPIDQYYSLCNRLDTLEHVHEVLVAVAAQMLGDAPDADGAPEPEQDAPQPVADEPSGGVN